MGFLVKSKMGRDQNFEFALIRSKNTQHQTNGLPRYYTNNHGRRTRSISPNQNKVGWCSSPSKAWGELQISMMQILSAGGSPFERHFKKRVLMSSSILFLLFIIKIKGTNKRTKRICRRRWCSISIFLHFLRHRSWSIMQCHWIPLPRIQKFSSSWKPG